MYVQTGLSVENSHEITVHAVSDELKHNVLSKHVSHR